MPLTLRLHPRAKRAIERAAVRRPTTVTGLIARIDEQGTVVIDLPNDEPVRELFRQIEAGAARYRRHDREADDGREGLSMGVRL